MTTYLEIQCFPMVNKPDGGSTLIENRGDIADFFDVMLSRRNDDTGEIDPLEEYENLDFPAANAIFDKLIKNNPSASYEWIYE